MKIKLLVACLLLAVSTAHAAVLESAAEGIKIPLTKKPTSRPMTMAFEPNYKRYFLADGGLGPIQDGNTIAASKSEIHAFDASGKYINSTQQGLDNRSLYFNPNTNLLETATYNISSGAGFTPDTGIFALELDKEGNLTKQRLEIATFNPAFGQHANCMPSYDPSENRYFSKQERSNKVLIVKLDKREPVAEIALDLEAAKVQSDDLSEYYVAYTGIPGEELAALDVDHKAVLVFNLTGKFVGKSALPTTMKLRAQNHLNGLGYANGMMFVYHEPEGEFGVYYGFKISDQAVTQ
ncbi:MAG: hypothetical protein ACKVN9_01365 [Methylophilaceae bacterium]